MGDRDEVRATVLESKDLDSVELAPSPAQQKAIAAGCIANAFRNFPPDRKEGLRSAVRGVEDDISAALDSIRKRRARMVQQKNNLNARKNKIEGGSASISSLYAYAEPAISACPEAANAARAAKEGSDIVHSRLNEIEYQLSLIDSGDLLLSAEERELSGAMSALDSMVLSLR